jgi:uncharacterized protein YkwD
VLARDVVRLVNAHRRERNLPTLAVSAPLTRSASWKASHMARYEYMRHNDPAPPVKRTVAARLAACGYPTTRGAWGENIAYGYETPAAVMRAWLKSPGHRRNIEGRLYAAIGVGVAEGENGLLYWAQNFGSNTDEGRGRG